MKQTTMRDEESIFFCKRELVECNEGLFPFVTKDGTLTTE
jgi:hypothetical protein